MQQKQRICALTTQTVENAVYKSSARYSRVSRVEALACLENAKRKKEYFKLNKVMYLFSLIISYLTKEY